MLANTHVGDRDCNAGFVRNALATACVACGTGYYRDASLNRVSTASVINRCYAARPV